MAWALYVLLRPVNATLAMLVGWLRLAAAAAFLPALANLLDVAQLLGGPAASTLPAAVVEAQVMSSIASFHNAWDIQLAVFGLHLLGVGALVYKSVQFPRALGVLVVVAGIGYLADTFTRILVPDFTFTFSLFTFVGEALLIVVTSVGANGAASFGDEYARLAGILDAASRLPDLGDRPLVVVTAASEPLDGWLVDQDHLATLSTNVTHRIYPDLTHLSLVDSASGATAASDAILAAVISVRSGTTLDAMQ